MSTVQRASSAERRSTLGRTTTLGMDSEPSISVSTPPHAPAQAPGPGRLRQRQVQVQQTQASSPRLIDPDEAERERRAKHARLAFAREPPSFSPSFGKTSEMQPVPLMSPTRHAPGAQAGAGAGIGAGAGPAPTMPKKANRSFSVCADAPGGRVIR
jgi:hypothetical protein